MKNFFQIIFFYGLSLLFPMALSAQGQRYYVDAQATGQLNGQSWTDAFRDLHDALALALSGDEIWVAEGVYHPAANDRTARYQLPSGVRLYGGFAGSEMLLEERQPADHPTVLSGDIGVIGDSLDNSYTLLYLPYPDASTLIDGLVFRDGLANDPNAGTGEVGASGAALYILGEDSIAYPGIQHCVFEYNTARSHGGAVFINGSGSGSVAPLFFDCQFRYNRAGLNGGAIYRDGASWWERPADLDHCTFEYNRAIRGGCFYLADAERSDTLQIVGSNFYHNYASHQADVMALGKVRQTGQTAVRIQHCEMENNLNQGIFATDVFFAEGNMDIRFDSSTFQNNISGPILINATLIGKVRCEVNHCSFYTNTPSSPSIRYPIIAESYPFVPDTLLLIHHSSFHQGRVTISASYGKLFIDKSIFNKNIGCDIIDQYYYIIQNSIFNNIYYLRLNNGNFVLIQNSIFFKNSLQPEYGVHDSLVHINNSIFWLLKDANGVAGYQSLFLTPPIQTRNCLFTDTLYSNRVAGEAPTPMLGPGVQIGPDPLFLNALNGDFHLDPCSPAWNAGDNASTIAQGLTTDFDDQPRIVDGQVDIGAYEVQSLRSSGPGVVHSACFHRPEGAVQWDLQNGCLPYTYQWSSGLATGSTTNGLAAGHYYFTITDSRGRALVKELNILAPSPEIRLDGDTLLCPAANDGTLMALVNAVPPTTYLWSTGSTGTVIDGLPPGTYSATLTDAVGCQASATAVIALAPPPVVTAQIGQASSMTTADGSLQVTVTSGQPPYMYAWAEVASTSPGISGLLPGTYHLSVTDGAGCTTPFQYEVGATSGTNAPEALIKGSVQPNPARAEVLLRFGDSTTWQLFSVTGVEVLRVEGQASGGLLPVDLSGLPAGLYFYAFSHAGKVISQERLFILGE